MPKLPVNRDVHTQVHCSNASSMTRQALLKFDTDKTLTFVCAYDNPC
jgi:hypothetical protein